MYVFTLPDSAFTNENMRMFQFRHTIVHAAAVIKRTRLPPPLARHELAVADRVRERVAQQPRGAAGVCRSSCPSSHQTLQPQRVRHVRRHALKWSTLITCKYQLKSTGEFSPIWFVPVYGVRYVPVPVWFTSGILSSHGNPTRLIPQLKNG